MKLWEALALKEELLKRKMAKELPNICGEITDKESEEFVEKIFAATDEKFELYIKLIELDDDRTRGILDQLKNHNSSQSHPRPV